MGASAATQPWGAGARPPGGLRRHAVHRGASVGLLWLTLIAAPAAAQPETAGEALGSIREMVFEARFPEAIEAARAFLARDGLTAAQRNAGLEVLAIAQIAERRTRDARRTLTELYRRDPQHRLDDPDASPPVLSAFARARERAPDPVRVTLSHRTPRLERREAPRVVVQIVDGADAVEEVRLTYRLSGEGGTQVVMTRRPDGSFVARIPVVGDASQALDVAYRIEALAPSGARLAEVGSDAEPLQLRIPPGATAVAVTPPDDAAAESPGGGGSVLEEWWFWVLVAAVVGGGVTAGVLVATGGGPERGSLGTVTLMSIEL